jgi:tetratricopeptide (TPR) repeat protein
VNEPTNQKMDTLGALVAAFRENPADGELYSQLRTRLIESKAAGQLAEIAELRAPHVRDALRASAIWAEAGLGRTQMGDRGAAERDLRTALSLDAGNEAAAKLLVDQFIEQRRYAEAAAILDAELEALAERAENSGRNGGGFAARRAERHRLLAHLWDRELGRVDQALVHWQRAWQLEPQNTKSLEAARVIYSSLGDEAMVTQLYEAELEVLADSGDSAERARIELELGRLLARTGDRENAAAHLEISIQLDPSSDEATEALAEVYASRHYAGDPDSAQKAAKLFVELGRRRLAAREIDPAIRFLRRALGVDPYTFTGYQLLEDALRQAQRWDELDRLYKHRSEMVDSTSERESLLQKRAELYDDQLPDRSGLKSSLEKLAAGSGGDTRSTHALRLRELYAADGDWKKLAALIESELEVTNETDPTYADELLELADVYREHLRDRDRAAELLHRVLSIDPHNEQALSRYADHFRERRDWRGLADLLEFAIENAQDAGATPSDIVRRLEELAKLSELRLGDVERAIATWQRVEEIEPRNPRVREAIRRLMSRAKMWESLVGVLEQEAQAAQTPEARAEALRRIAQVYRERQVNPRQAIALYEEVLASFPDDEGVLKALTELYEREGDDAGLASTIRRQIDLDMRRISEQLGGAPIAKDWPVAKRVERLTSLRRLASMYEDKLADVEGVVFACGGILEILPGDRDALERMERVLEKAGDVPRLEQTLEYHAAAATGPAEKAKVLRRMARLAADRTDEVASMERWEQVLSAAPNDREALEALGQLYDRHERWGELATVLERSLVGRRPPEPGSPEAAQRSFGLKRYAQVVHERLGDANRATRAWQSVLEISPKDREALAALAALHESAGRWRDLVSVLDRLSPLYATDEPERAAEVCLRRAALLEDRLGAPVEAAAALEQLIADIDPRSLEAHQALRRLYESRADFEAAVRIAEREMYLTDNPAERISRGLEIGFLCRDRLNDPARALQAFERVLEIEPGHGEALAAAAELYAKLERWHEHVDALERRVESDSVDEGPDRRQLMLRIGAATADKLGNHRRAFEWYRTAHEHAPDATTIAELRRTAEAYDLWSELAQVYEKERAANDPKAGGDVNAYIAACRELAAIAERRLDDKELAMSVLRDALAAQPDGEDLLGEATRIAAEADRRELWEILLSCLEVRLLVADRESRVQILTERARLREERLGDGEGAVEELLRAFSWAPDREATRTALYDLAERVGSWPQVVAVEAALFERAASTQKRVELLHRKAQVIEDKLTDRVRAFRTHLSAFLLAPDNTETTTELWRLAREIDRYQPTDRIPKPESAPAHVESDPAAPAAGRAAPVRPARGSRPGSGGAAAVIHAAKPRDVDATQELSLGDLFDLKTRVELDGDRAAAGANGEGELPPEEKTQPIDLNELEEVGNVGRADPTMELRTQDLIEVLGAKKGAGAPPVPPERKRRPGGPPPPPPPPPKIVRTPGMPRPLDRRQAEAVKRPAPTLPARSYDSPWAEFAAAYDQLPARDKPAKLRWLFRISELWETGAGDIPKAFDALARAMDLTPEDAEPRDRLYRLAAEHGEWDRLAELYQIAADSASSADRAVELLVEVADIRGQEERTAESEAIYRRILGMRPEHSMARENLEALYRDQGRWVDLAASLEERTDPRLGVAAPEAQRPALLRELAAIYSDKLGRPHDAIDALERLRELSPDDVDVLDHLADLYSQIQRWSKVVEMLKRVCEVDEGSEGAQRALHHIGHIYEVELELPDRAVDAYVQLVAGWPADDEALEALDRLYVHQGRWSELVDILDRRAANEREPAAKVELLRRRAEAQMVHLDAPEQAAVALRHARTIAPDDPQLADTLADMLIGALIAAGHEREAGSILEGRIEALKARGASAGDIAALLTRLAAVRAEHLRDPEGAKQVIEEALNLVPNHPTALATLARLAEARHDPVAYAEAKLREADVHKDTDAKVAALIAAGKTLRDIGDIDGARGAFERVLELRAYHPEATWALASLVEASGDPGTAAKLLETRLGDDELELDERAQVLTQLAALARQAGVESVAERRLAEALNVVPDHIPAVLGTADLLSEAGRWPHLVEFLADVIEQLGDARREHLAEIHRRLALAKEALGADDEAYQTLLAADRLDRGNLLIKLAMGENRYRARRWREAGLHLSVLAAHPNAERYPAEVAEGLYHAALAEIRSLRPEQAEGLYERAVELKPNYSPALQALAEIALERGDNKRAADLLTRQASATDQPAERMRLFEALGDMALTVLGEPERALVCFEAAVGAAVPLESQHVPLLRKLLDQQTSAGDHLGAARTAELMASFGKTGAERAERLKLAAEQYLAGEQPDRAKEAARRAIEADPYDLTAVGIASEIAMNERDFEATAAMLGRALLNPQSEATDEITRFRQANLWYRLGLARLERGDTGGAITALESAVETAAESDGAMMARRKLLDLWSADPEHADRVLDYRRQLASDTMDPDDAASYAKALIETGHSDGGRVALELSAHLGRELDNDDVAFLGTHPVKMMAEDEPYRGAVEAEDRAALLSDPDDLPLTEVFASLWEAAPLMWSDTDAALERVDARYAERIGGTSEIPAAAVFTRVARALKAPATVLFADDRDRAADINVVFVSPPVITMGPNILGTGDEQPSDLELRFLLARAAELARPERIFARMPEADLANLVASVARLFGNIGEAGEMTAQRDDRFLKTLPVRIRQRLKELLRERLPDNAIARYKAATKRVANRAGLLICGDLDTAVRWARTRGLESDTRYLERMVLAPKYLELRERLGIGVRR